VHPNQITLWKAQLKSGGALTQGGIAERKAMIDRAHNLPITN
jgi:hypothetical protein